MIDGLRIIFVIKSIQGWVGGREYFENLIYTLGNLAHQKQAINISIFSNEELSPHIQPFISNVYTHKDLHPESFTERITWKINRYLSNDDDPNFDSFLKREKFDTIYPYYSHDKRPKPYRSAAWIPDFQHKHLPEFFTKSELRFRDKSFSEITSNAEKVILSSEVAQADCHQYFPDSIGKTCVLPFRSIPRDEWYQGDPIKIQKKYNLPVKFLLVSNQFWKHKNHLLLFKSLQLLQKQSIFPIIVCTGGLHDYRDPDYSNQLLSYIHELGVSDQVKILGLIPKIDQLQLIRRSIAVIQPSLFEGWSTIIENVRCFGKPMIVSDLPVHIEQDVPNSILFNRYSAEQLAESISGYWGNLSPGPDLKREDEARIQQQVLIDEFGKNILDIFTLNKTQLLES